MEEIKKTIKNRFCEWCWIDLKENHKAEYEIISSGFVEYICKGHFQEVLRIKEEIKSEI